MHRDAPCHKPAPLRPKTRRGRIALIGGGQRLLADYLADLGYDIVQAASAAAWIESACHVEPDLLVVDLSSEEALDVLRRLRDGHPAPLLALAADADPVERVAGLEIGADDVVAVPAEAQEIAARIGNMLERRGIGRREIVRLERTTVDLVAARLLRPGAPPQRLGPGEVALIRAFSRAPNRVLGRDDLLDAAAAESADAADRTIDARVGRLRRKLATDAFVTVRGHGYMFVPPFDHPTDHVPHRRSFP